MNRLPSVLRKEIWEYVRGDRTCWKNKFDMVMAELSVNFMRWLEQQYLDGESSLKQIIETKSVKHCWSIPGDFHDILQYMCHPRTMVHAILTYQTYDFHWGRTDTIPLYEPRSMERFGWKRIH
jgi:hypothetical protein